MTTNARPFPPPALLLLLIGCAGFAAIWLLVARLFDTHAAWLAPVAALDAILLLRLGRAAYGWKLAGAATLATAATIALANYGIVAMEIGYSFDLPVWESALRLGRNFAWELILLANDPVEKTWYALALLVAAFGGLNGRRPAPSAR